MGTTEGMRLSYDVDNGSLHKPDGDTEHDEVPTGMEDTEDDISNLRTETGHEWYRNSSSGSSVDTSLISSALDTLNWEIPDDPSVASDRFSTRPQAPADLQPVYIPKSMNRGTKLSAVAGLLAVLMAVVLLKITFLAPRRLGQDEIRDQEPLNGMPEPQGEEKKASAGDRAEREGKSGTSSVRLGQDEIRDQEPLNGMQEPQGEEKKASAGDRAEREGKSGTSSVHGDEKGYEDASSPEQIEAEREEALNELEEFLSLIDQKQ